MTLRLTSTSWNKLDLKSKQEVLKVNADDFLNNNLNRIKLYFLTNYRVVFKKIAISYNDFHYKYYKDDECIYETLGFHITPNEDDYEIYYIPVESPGIIHIFKYNNGDIMYYDTKSGIYSNSELECLQEAGSQVMFDLYNTQREIFDQIYYYFTKGMTLMPKPALKAYIYNITQGKDVFPHLDQVSKEIERLYHISLDRNNIMAIDDKYCAFIFGNRSTRASICGDDVEYRYWYCIYK